MLAVLQIAALPVMARTGITHAQVTAVSPTPQPHGLAPAQWVVHPAGNALSSGTRSPVLRRASATEVLNRLMLSSPSNNRRVSAS